nr:poly(U)-specific endoribonuclease-D-like [Pelodiscus sinensis]|eukprot:XP_014424160.1 poly(U)-specific endoribonuclease-D-like [Pelodiscus sinensis]
MTGTAEQVTASEEQEVDAFLDEIFKTQVMQKLSQFFLSKGIYLSHNDFKADLKEMWFGLYSRSKGAAMDSSGFEHVFHGTARLAGGRGASGEGTAQSHGSGGSWEVE